MHNTIELTSSVDEKRQRLELLESNVSHLETVVHEYQQKTDTMESELFSHFSDIINTKKRKIRHLQDLTLSKASTE